MYYIYRIYYNDEVVYVGRTTNIDNRIRQHVLTGKMVNVAKISKIEVAQLETEADMNLYELYYILSIKPKLNIKDTTQDELTFELPELEFREYFSYKYSEWKKKALEKKMLEHEKARRTLEIKSLLKDEKTTMGKEILMTEYRALTAHDE